MNLWACFIPQRGSRFGVHLDRVLSPSLVFIWLISARFSQRDLEAKPMGVSQMLKLPPSCELTTFRCVAVDGDWLLYMAVLIFVLRVTSK